ncbi:MAG TPA: aspartate--tRNA ligase [Firmicutes bacterium]|nr:aspartate--tRNA ligase [Bacillota bacterium]
MTESFPFEKITGPLCGEFRSHPCGQLRVEHAGQRVRLSGWVHHLRVMGGVIFLVLRDRWGIVQITCDQSISPGAYEIANSVKNEWVLRVRGTVARRPVGLENPDMPTGEIEIKAEYIEILNKSEIVPLIIEAEGGEDVAFRWKYRYLELRRPAVQRRLILRDRIIKFIRDYHHERGFIEVETPILAKSTPEGARDFLVPSRIEHGKFYALPQSPQMFKQLCMIAGFDKYFQIPKCFRDEDLRANRAPEFTQLDVEMSFITEEDVYRHTEDMMVGLIREFTGKAVQQPIPRFTYNEAMENYGTDRPDLRFDLPLIDIGEAFVNSDVQIFSSILSEGGTVRCIHLPGAQPSRKEIDEFQKEASKGGAKGLAWIAFDEGGEIRSPLSKHLKPEEIAKIRELTNANDGDSVLIVAGEKKTALVSLGYLRLALGKFYDLIEPGAFRLCWVTDFPMFEYSETEGKIVSEHHPFTQPNAEHWQAWIDAGKPMEGELLFGMLSRAYDIVLNGDEIGGGSIRIHDPEQQREIFRILGLSDDEIKEKFGFFIEALSYGTPPHGGIAPGIDRIVMHLVGGENIAECMAFPKTLKATDLMLESPSAVTEKQLSDLGLKLIE